MNKNKKSKFEEVKDMMNDIKLLVHADPYNKEEHTLFYRPETASILTVNLKNDKLINFDLSNCQLVSLSQNGLLIQYNNELYPIKLYDIELIKIL